jgi:hypothetical protein
VPNNDPQAPLRQAARDVRHLLARGYPRELVLKLAGDRWGLDAAGRHLLRRGAFAPPEARARAARLLGLAELAGQAVGVDGHNVLLTLEAALAGRPLVAADDGVVRDISGLGRHHRPGPGTTRAARLMAGALARAGAAEARVWLDAPLAKSGELAAEVQGFLAAAGLAGAARAVPVPERELARHSGPVATSDSALIDQVAAPVDLAGCIIRGMAPPPRLEAL